jgi:hypothetical protein
MNIASEMDRIQHFVAGGNYHAALNLSLSALNECRRQDNQQGVDVFIDLMKTIVQALAEEFGSQ